MAIVADIERFLGQIAPLRLAESWDNVGLLVGNRLQSVASAMTCLTVTPETVAEAIEDGADLIVTHHPLPFLPVKKLTSESTLGQMLLDLIAGRVAVYSAHTAWDSAAEGINQLLAEGLKLRGIQPLLPHPSGQGTGRCGWLQEPTLLREFASRLRTFIEVERIQVVGHDDNILRTIGVACGSAGELLDAARSAGCDALVVGEARFHSCLEAEASGVSLLLPGHYASERFSMDVLAQRLSKEFAGLRAWASRRERDPLRWIE